MTEGIGCSLAFYLLVPETAMEISLGATRVEDIVYHSRHN